MVDGVVDFLFKWEEKNRKRTGRRSTQDPDQIIPYVGRRLFVLMQKSLGRLVNLFEEIHVRSIWQKICFASLVTLSIESFFSLMREDDPMPTQLAYGTRRSAFLRELDKRMTTSLAHLVITQRKLFMHHHHLTLPRFQSSKKESVNCL